MSDQPKPGYRPTRRAMAMGSLTKGQWKLKFISPSGEVVTVNGADFPQIGAFYYNCDADKVKVSIREDKPRCCMCGLRMEPTGTTSNDSGDIERSYRSECGVTQVNTYRPPGSPDQIVLNLEHWTPPGKAENAD